MGAGFHGSMALRVVGIGNGKLAGGAGQGAQPGNGRKEKSAPASEAGEVQHGAPPGDGEASGDGE